MRLKTIYRSVVRSAKPTTFLLSRTSSTKVPLTAVGTTVKSIRLMVTAGRANLQRFRSQDLPVWDRSETTAREICLQYSKMELLTSCPETRCYSSVDLVSGQYVGTTYFQTTWPIFPGRSALENVLLTE